jgi:hypothetical protein
LVVELRKLGLLKEEVGREEEDRGVVSNGLFPSSSDHHGKCAAESSFHEERHPWESCDSPLEPKVEETPCDDYYPD